VSSHGIGGAASDSTLLGDELTRLVDRQGLRVSRIVPVTSVASPIADRAAFRVELEDGTSIKARRFKSADGAAAQQRLLGRWSGAGFPAILAADGRAMLLEWVDGESFAARPRAASAFQACGELLGRLHTFSPVGGDGGPASAVADWRTRVLDWTRRLRERDLLSAGEAASTISLLDATAPAVVEIGPAHLDFSAANLILDRNGKPVAIDNETIALAPLDLDLAICESRWPMQPWQRAAFELGYERHRELDGYRRARPFWHLCYLTRRAALKSRRPGDAYVGAIEALRALLDEARDADR
jgi:Ser/Thr protein kinase RdoA (MazF antagonist)